MTADQLALDDLSYEVVEPSPVDRRPMNSDEQRADRWRRLEAARQAPRREFRITCVRLSDHEDRGRRYWTANVSANGVTVHVDRRYGSWHAVEGAARREVLPHIARELQRAVARAERAEATS